MNDWMMCNSCRRTVRQNPTGICLSCQSGFSGEVCAIHLPKVSVVDCRWLDGDKWGTRLAKVVTMKIDSIQGVEEE